MTSTHEETELTPELISRVMKLSREDLGRLVGLALDELDEPMDDPESVRDSWRELLANRWKAIQNGAIPTVSAADAIAYARQRLAERTGR